MTRKELKRLCRWKTSERVEDGRVVLISQAKPTDDFWRAWRAHRRSLKRLGVRIEHRGQGKRVIWSRPIGRARKQQLLRNYKASYAENGPRFPAPKGREYRAFQRAAIAYALPRRDVLIGDDPGLGKTIEAIGVLNADASCKRVLIICPNHLKINWQNELRAWSSRRRKVYVVRAGERLPDISSVDTLVCNYEQVHKLRPIIDQVSWDVLIVDEAHWIKTPTAKRTEAILGARYMQRPILPGPIEARRRLFLTGTPFENRPIELWPIVQACDPHGLGRSFTQFTLRYCGARFDGYKMRYDGAQNLEELGRLLRERFLVRRRKEDVLRELPPKQWQVIELPADGFEKLLKQEIETYDSLIGYVRGARSKRKLNLSAREKLSKIRLSVARAKLPLMIEHLRASLDEGPVVFFAWHHEILDAVAEEFGNDAVKLSGKEKTTSRKQRAVERFQSGKAALFIGQMRAAGTGITLTRSKHVIFGEMDWVPATLRQCADRCDRIGQKSSVLVQILVLHGSLDAIMAGTVLRKEKSFTTTLD